MKKMICSKIPIRNFRKIACVKLIFCLAPLFSTFSAAEIDSVSFENKPQQLVGKIYVEEGTVISGIENIYNAELIKVKKVKTKSVKDFAPKRNALSKQIKSDSAAKKLEQIEVQNVQKEKNSKNIGDLFTSFPSDSSEYTQKRKSLSDAVVSSHHHVQSVNVVLSHVENLTLIFSQLTRQKFYTSLSYLQFRKFRSSSLRGPPNPSIG